MFRYLTVLLLVLLSCNNQKKEKSSLRTHDIYKDTVITLKILRQKGLEKVYLLKIMLKLFYIVILSKMKAT